MSISSRGVSLPGWLRPLVEHIIRHYSNALKIVEVGVGKLPHAACEIKRCIPNVKLLVTDVDEDVLRLAKACGLEVARDDVTKPTVELYRGASLIYAVRAPPELWPYLIELAKSVRSDVMILPLHSDLEAVPEELELVIVGKACLLVGKFSRWR